MKRKNRILSLLLCVVMLLTAVPESGTRALAVALTKRPESTEETAARTKASTESTEEIEASTKAPEESTEETEASTKAPEESTEVTKETEESTPPVTEMCVREDHSVKVRGQLPKGAVLSVEEITEPQEEPAKPAPKKSAPGKDAGTKTETEKKAEIASDTVKTYDIKLILNGDEIQPNGTVRVTFTDVPVYEEGYIHVIHILDSAEAIRAGKGIAVRDAAAVAAFPKEAGIAFETTGEADTVYVELFSLSEGTVGIDEENHPYVDTTSFSTYYVVSGNSELGSTDSEITNISYEDNNTFYVAPGTQLTFFRDDTWVIIIGTQEAKWRATANTGNLKYDTRSKSSSTWQSVTTSSTTFWGQTYYDWTNGNYLRVTVSENCPVGTQSTVYSKLLVDGWEVGITFIVMSEEDILEHILEDSNYPVYLSVLKDASGGTPGEPGISDLNDFYYATSSFGIGGTTNHYAASGAGIIDEDIYTNPYFVHSADGTNTMGLVDSTGELVKSAISLDDDDFSAFLTAIANRGNVKASDGVTITAANKNNYKVVPYVVKLLTAYSIGWHIDCQVVPKDAITVSYDANIPEGFTVENISLPNSRSGPTVTMTMGNPQKDGTNIAMNGSVQAVSAGVTYHFTFKGWNTKSDGSGTSYVPGNTATFEEETVLYAIWETNIAEGTLELRNTVTTAEGSAAPPPNDTFAYTVNFGTQTTPARPYTIYNAQGAVQRTGTILPGGTLTLGDGEWARITGVPTGAYSTTQGTKPHYTTTLTGASGMIRGGATSSADYVNEYALFSVTGSFDGGHGTVTNGSQTELGMSDTCQAMVFTPEEGYQITSVEVNGVTQTGVSPSGYTFPAQEITESKEVVAHTEPIEYTITYDLDGGSVSPANPTSYTVETEAFTLKAPTRAGYVFEGWTGSNGTTPQMTVTIPDGEPGGKTYTAHWREDTGSLTITKTGCSAGDADQVFVFHVAGTDANTAVVALDVMVVGNGSVTVQSLPAGGYQVTEDAAWSWRYTSTGPYAVSVTGGADTPLTAANTRSNPYWLNDCDHAVNRK